MSRVFSGIQPSGELHIGNYLGAGLDPAKCTVFIQSAVPEHAELASRTMETVRDTMGLR